MFERYTERARRVIFFARYEASQLGSNSIETEHLLLGLIREGKGLTSRIFSKSHLSMESIRKEIEGRALYRDKVSTSVDIPLSSESSGVSLVLPTFAFSFRSWTMSSRTDVSRIPFSPRIPAATLFSSRMRPRRMCSVPM